MKGGIVPIHIMRFAPADYLGDPSVKLALAEDRIDAVAFYPLFLFHSFLQGGSLASDVRLLAATISMPKRRVEKALAFWKQQGKIEEKDGYLYQKRVTREVERELEFRRAEAERKRQKRLAMSGGHPADIRRTSGGVRAESEAPTPAPAPAPSNVHPSLRDVGVSVATPTLPIDASVVEAPAQSVGDRPIRQLSLRGTNPRPLKVPGGWPAQVVRLWAGAGTPARVGAALSQVVDRFGEERVLRDLEKWLAVPGNARFGIETFARTVGESDAAPQSARSRETVASIKAEILGGMK